jgi:predicted nuclease with TOPRIM domain
MSATMEERVSVLERDVTQLKTRFAVTDPKVEALESDLAAVPELIKLEGRLNESRFARFRSDMAEMKSDLRSEIKDLRTEMNERFDAVIRVVSELVAGGRERR